MVISPSGGIPEWLKYLGAIIASVVIAYGVSVAQRGPLPQAALSNCEDINDLKGTLRELVLLTPNGVENPESEDFINRALSLLAPVNCRDRVAP